MSDSSDEEQEKSSVSKSNSQNESEISKRIPQNDILDGADVKMELEISDDIAPSRLWASHKFSEEDDEDDENKHPKERLGDEETEEILNPDVKDNKEAFTEYYLGLMTGGSFGDDLNKARQSNDFNNKTSMPLLIAALKEGVNMFDKEQRDLILSAQNKETV